MTDCKSGNIAMLKIVSNQAYLICLYKDNTILIFNKFAYMDNIIVQYTIVSPNEVEHVTDATGEYKKQ
jgi:hypothetical protein